MIESSYLSDTRWSYDRVAGDYAELYRDGLAALPLQRAMLAAFAEMVLAGGGGQVADLGCGPGHLTAQLASLGLSPFGVDLSPGMVAVARQRYPELRFQEGSMTALELEDGPLGGILAWYSIVHTPPEVLPTVFEEFARVLAPGGHLLLGFHVGDGGRPKTTGYGHSVRLTVYRWQPDLITELAARAGLVMQARLIAEPEAPVPHACLLARKPPTPS